MLLTDEPSLQLLKTFLNTWKNVHLVLENDHKADVIRLIGYSGQREMRDVGLLREKIIRQ